MIKNIEDIEDDDLLIPEDVVLRIFSRDLGVDFKTVDEIATYLDNNPLVRGLLESKQAN